MPSLKMKTKSSTECPREKNLLSVCQKSTLISKNLYSNTRSSEIDTCIQCIENDSPSTEMSVEEIRCDEAVDYEEFVDTITEDLELLKQDFFLIDPITIERKDFTQAHCQSDFETIFSPVLECAEVHDVTNGFNDEVIKDDADVPQLRADDYQICNVSDFYISDMIITRMPLDGNPIRSDVTLNNPFLDHQWDESSILFDMAEHYMLLPFLEDTIEKNNNDTQVDKSSEETLTEPDLYLAINQLKSCDQDSDVNLINSESDQAGCYDPRDIIKDLPDLSDASTFWPPLLPKEMFNKKSVTLVLDLDETLVHSTLEHCDGADFTFQVFFNMKDHTVYVKQRPFMKTFLERVAEMFNIIVFTASQSIYAEQLLDILDPDGKLICQRFYRESCIFSDGSYTKDLTILGVELAKVAIIDNSPQVFQMQVNNGIPIKSWFDDPSDRALISLLPFLETLVDADDVRPIIANKFGNKE